MVKSPKASLSVNVCVLNLEDGNEEVNTKSSLRFIYFNCAKILVQLPQVFFFFSCAFIQQILIKMSFRKPLVCCLTEHFDVFLMYIQEQTTSHAHEVDTVDLCSISKNWDYLDSVSATTSITASFSIKGYLFPFSMVTCEEQAH